MKLLPSQLFFFFQNTTTKRNLSLLAKFFVFLALVIILYSILFHVIMLYEGRDYSWVTGLYWSLTVMSTLGFGDITFSTDLGLLFTMLVLVSGVLFLLIILPFTFIQFFYAPWLEAQLKTRTPSKVSENMKGHVIITHIDPVTRKLVNALKKQNYPYVIIEADFKKALEIHDLGYTIVVGPLDDPQTYRNVQVEKARMVVATNDDMMNTNISLTVREITEKVQIVTNADNEHSLDILEFPGNVHVYQFTRMLGEAMGKRTLGVRTTTNVIGRFEELLVAETPAVRSHLEGKILSETGLRETTGVTVVGVWEKGKFQLPQADTLIGKTAVLVIAGSVQQLEKFDEGYTEAGYRSEAPVLILGGGRVGQTVAETLEEQNIPFKVVEKSLEVVDGKENYICGNAADKRVLMEAGIDNVRSVIITTHNDDMNIYLTFYCRQLRPKVQIITRSNRGRNVSTLHRAGADLVMSYASMGASAILKILQPGEVSMFTEGLHLFSTKVLPSLRGKVLAESKIREKSGCSVIGIKKNGVLVASPGPNEPLAKGDELILIGGPESEERFQRLM